MSSNVEMLDCTLRDGGYVNDWEFGHSVMTGTYRRLDEAGVDYIELGFLDDRRSFDLNRSIMPSTSAVDRIFGGVKKRHAQTVAMIDFGTCGIEKISPASESFLDCIRVIFKKEKIAQALPFCKKIKSKGYKLFIQAISITAYSDMDILKYVEQINEIKPYAFSIVDTYGLLDDKELERYFTLIDRNLDPEIKIGYHAHNNFQLGFSNTRHFLSMPSRRDKIADATVYGMGKSAGNCPSELLAMYLNEQYGKSYDLNMLLEIVDTDLMQIYQAHYWGYKYNFYISALQRCHPNYVRYLLDKKTLSITQVNAILAMIPDEKRLFYDEKWTEQAYINYQTRIIDDEGAYAFLGEHLRGCSEVVIIGPGQTLESETAKVVSLLERPNCVVFAVNFCSEKYKVDFVFMSNGKRYSKLADIMQNKKIAADLLLTSNITPLNGYQATRMFNFETLVDGSLENKDNALMLLLNLLLRLGIRSVKLAGFDGFSGVANDYCNPTFDFATNTADRNKSISRDLKKMSERIAIEFVTTTRYDV